MALASQIRHWTQIPPPSAPVQAKCPLLHPYYVIGATKCRISISIWSKLSFCSAYIEFDQVEWTTVLHQSSRLTFVTRRTVVYTFWPLLAKLSNFPSWWTEDRGMSLPLESSRPTTTGINIGSFAGWPGVGGTSWLGKHQMKYVSLNHKG